MKKAVTIISILIIVFASYYIITRLYEIKNGNETAEIVPKNINQKDTVTPPPKPQSTEQFNNFFKKKEVYDERSNIVNNTVNNIKEERENKIIELEAQQRRLDDIKRLQAENDERMRRHQEELARLKKQKADLENSDNQMINTIKNNH